MMRDLTAKAGKEGSAANGGTDLDGADT